MLVHPLEPFTQIQVDTAISGAVEDSLVSADLQPLPATTELAQAVPAQTYVWCREVRDLESELSSFEEFVQKNAWKWIGSEAQSNEN